MASAISGAVTYETSTDDVHPSGDSNGRDVTPNQPSMGHPNGKSPAETVAARQRDGNSCQDQVKVGEESVNPLKWDRTPNDEQMSHPARWLSPPGIS